MDSFQDGGGVRAKEKKVMLQIGTGLDIKEIQYLAGHTTVDMTLRVYTHYQHETRQQDTANKVCAALG